METIPQLQLGCKKDIETAARLLFKLGDVVELRIPHTKNKQGTVSGYFDDLQKLAEAAFTQDAKARAHGVYYTLNPVKPDILARSNNRVQAWAKHTTKDHEIVHRRWLPIDLDAVRPAGVSATEAEKQKVLDRAVELGSFLLQRGWPEPVYANSGNGCHVLFRVDLPNDDSSTDLLKRCLAVLAFTFNDATVVVDEGTFNAARLVRAYGTVARKGDETEDRPHRRSGIFRAPEEIQVVPRQPLEELAGQLPDRQKPWGGVNGGGTSFDLAKWIANQGAELDLEGPLPWKGGSLWRIRTCPWDQTHTNSAHIVQFPSGAVAAGCHHDSCSDKDWHALRDLLDPGWRATERTQAEPIDPPPSEMAVEPFPVDVLPAPLRRYVEESAQAIGVPADFIAVPLLSALGVAIGTTRRLELKSSWRELPTVWTAIVAEPGSAKSPALQHALKGVFEHQDELAEDYRWHLADYKRRKDQGQQERTEESQGGYEPEKDETSEDPHPPVRKQVFTSDSTTEALADVLLQNLRGLLFYQDELAGWARSFNQYKGKSGADRQTWSSFWNSAPVMINRRNRQEPLHLEESFVCAAGAIPPDVLSELHDELGREDGFISRILFAFPETQAARWTDAAPAQSTVTGYKRVFEKLFNLRSRISLLPGQRCAVCLTEKGKEKWIEFYNKHVDEMNAPDFPYPLRAPWAKLRGYCARFALILQMARVASDEVESEDVDEVSIQRAVRLVDYFQSHARKVYASLHSTQQDKELARAIKFLKEHDGSASVRDFVTCKVAGCQTKRNAEELFRKLEEAGWGKIDTVTPSKGGRPSVVFRLHSATEPKWSGD